METKKFEVEICRIHKSSPFNCAGIIPEISAKSDNDILSHPEFIKLLRKTPGNKFIVNIHCGSTNTLSQFEIEVNRN